LGRPMQNNNGFLPSFPGFNPEAGTNGYRNSFQPFYDIFMAGSRHSVGFSLALKTISILSHVQELKAGIRFNALQFSDSPTWSIQIAL
jgi:hypothetical protein